MLWMRNGFFRIRILLFYWFWIRIRILHEFSGIVNINLPLYYRLVAYYDDIRLLRDFFKKEFKFLNKHFLV
jgi:hypothetical protein